MKWWSLGSDIPNTSNFHTIIDGLVFKCPSSISKTKKENNSASNKRITVYEPVSKRMSSFRSRGITSHYLSTLLAQIRYPLKKSGAYVAANLDDDIAHTTSHILESTNLSDPEFDLIVFCPHSNMSTVESILYYIRNAFAHGSFEAKSINGGYVYYLECAKDGIVKAQMRLKESTLLQYVKLTQLNISDIRNLQKVKSDSHR